MRTHTNTHTMKGSIALETALMLPLVLLIFMALMDFGRMYWTYGVVTGAAQEGARVAVLAEPSDFDVVSAVVENLNSGGVPHEPEVILSERAPAQPVSVTVEVPFEFMLLKGFSESSYESALLTISATATMEHER